MDKKNVRTAIDQLEKIPTSYDNWEEVYQLLVNAYYRLLRDSDYSRSERVNLNAEAEARYRLGMELRDKGNLRGAINQFSKIHSQAKEFDEAQSSLTEIYVILGQQEHQDGKWQDATGWWHKALSISPDLGETLQGRIRAAKARAWVKSHGPDITIVGLLVAILSCIFTVWDPLDWWHGVATNTPSPTLLVSPATVTPTTTTPTGTPTPGPTLPTPTLTPTTPTSTPTYTPTSTPTPTPSQTPTYTPTQTPTLTFTPTPTPVPPTLIAPDQGGEYRSPVTFQWSGQLWADQAYQVTARHPGSGNVIQSGLLRDQEWSADLPGEQYGEWRWTVSVVQGGRAVATSNEWMFWFKPTGGSGSGGTTPPTPANPIPTPANP